MEVDEPPGDPAPAEEEDGMSSLLPGANAMKRRRAEMGSQGYEEPKITYETARKPKRQKVDVLEAARRHREEEEATDRKPEEEAFIQAAIENMTIEEMKGLVVVEELEVPLRGRRTPPSKETERWDARWNGRKNFKKFRRKGDAPVPRMRIQKVIVPLEEVKRKDHGSGDHYWTSRARPTSPSPIFSRGTSQQQDILRDSISQGESRGSVSQQRDGSETSRPSISRPSQRLSQKRARDTTRDNDDGDGDEELRFKFRRRR
jgi:hypothetical protein